MSTEKEYVSLHNALEAACRIMEGVGVAFARAGHYGFSTFARCEAAERRKYAEQIIRHMESHNMRVMLPGHRAPACEYDEPVAAIDAMIEADKKSIIHSEALKDAIIKNREDPYFLIELMEKLHYELNEIYEIKACVVQGDDLRVLNVRLLEQYNPCGKK